MDDKIRTRVICSGGVSRDAPRGAGRMLVDDFSQEDITIPLLAGRGSQRCRRCWRRAVSWLPAHGRSS